MLLEILLNFAEIRICDPQVYLERIAQGILDAELKEAPPPGLGAALAGDGGGGLVLRYGAGFIELGGDGNLHVLAHWLLLHEITEKSA